MALEIMAIIRLPHRFVTEDVEVAHCSSPPKPACVPNQLLKTTQNTG